MAEIAKKHHAEIVWDRLIVQIREEMLRRQVHPSRVVVLLPYAQLIGEAREAWVRAMAQASLPALFLPRFETSMNWTRSLGGFEFSGDDLRLDAARDILTAASLLKRAGLASHQQVLASRLVEAASSLARTAAAVAPNDRVGWGTDLAPNLVAGLDAPVLALEAATAQLALAWVASSNFPSDPVFTACPDLLVVLNGFQAEPMALALQKRLGEQALALSLVPPLNDLMSAEWSSDTLALHAALDAEDEAHRAAACVLQHLAAGRSPVALVAQDRVLTRRVSAMLSERGVSVRDETGWKLSTTRAAGFGVGCFHRQCAGLAQKCSCFCCRRSGAVGGGLASLGRARMAFSASGRCLACPGTSPARQLASGAPLDALAGRFACGAANLRPMGGLAAGSGRARHAGRLALAGRRRAGVFRCHAAHEPS